MKRQMFIGCAFAVVAIVLLVSGCESETSAYTPNASDLTAIQERYDGADKEAVQATAVARYLAAESAQAAQEQAAAQIAALEATRQAAQNQEQRQYVALTAVANATEQAHRREVEQRNQWATQQAANATQVHEATAQALAVAATSQALSMQATAEQRSFEATATADALNRSTTATADARNVAATAQAQYQADIATATRQAWEGRVTATAESHQATAAAYSATATRAAEKREMTLGAVRDFGVPVILLLVFIGLVVLVVIALRQQAQKPIIYPRSVLGDAEPMAIKTKDGGYTLVDLDRQPGPALTVLPSGQVAAPLLRSAGQEERTTARDQLVDGMSRPKLGAGAKGAQSLSLPMPAPPQAPAPGLRSVRVLRRLDQAERAGFLPPPLVAALAADWEEEQ
ncbi:MAG: hypothetical protein SWK90_14280 [Chloroflexota bacterium]|nr:hypothetical protein [Chloroflexota bacterium]